MPPVRLELATERENRVGVAQRDASGVRQFQAAADALEQLEAEDVLERADLAADRLRRHVQALARPRHAAGPGDGPEVVEVLVVERAHDAILRKYRT